MEDKEIKLRQRTNFKRSKSEIDVLIYKLLEENSINLVEKEIILRYLFNIVSSLKSKIDEIDRQELEEILLGEDYE